MLLEEFLWVKKRKNLLSLGLGVLVEVFAELAQLGMEVMAIDSDEDKINEFANIASHAVIADSTDEMVLKVLVFVILIM